MNTPEPSTRFNGVNANVQSSGARTLVRSSIVNAGLNFGPSLNAAQFDAIDSYYGTMPAAACCLATPSS